MEKETSLAVDSIPPALPPSTKLEISGSICPPLPDFIAPPNDVPVLLPPPRTPPPQLHQAQSQNVRTGVDPRFTRCAFCETKHPGLVWGSYKMTTKELSRLSFCKCSKALQLGTFICEAAYDYLIGITCELPSDVQLSFQTRQKSEFLGNGIYPSLLPGNSSSGSFNGVTGNPNITPSSISQNLALNPGIVASMTPLPKFVWKSMYETRMVEPTPELDKVINDRAKARIPEYISTVEAFSELETVITELAKVQKRTVEFVSRLNDSVKNVLKDSEPPLPPPPKRVKKSVEQTIESFSSRVDAIVDTIHAATTIKETMEAIKEDLNKII